MTRTGDERDERWAGAMGAVMSAANGDGRPDAADATGVPGVTGAGRPRRPGRPWRIVAALGAGGGRIGRAPGFPLAAAVALGLASMAEVVLTADPFEGGQAGPPSTAEMSTAFLLGLAATMPVIFARARPPAAAVTVTAATFMTVAGDERPTAAGVVALFAVFYLVGLRHRRWVPAAMVLPFAAYVVAPFDADMAGKRLAVLLLSVTAAAAAYGSIRRAHREAAERDASRRAIADTLLEHAARGERARIARELHDVVAHHISMIAVQAETARLATPGMPADGAKRLLAIGDTARAALTEMRRLLGVLREDAGTETTRRPQPGLEHLNELIDEARDSAAASTRLIVSGQVTSLDPGIELTAYRIVQEALTNARRHAPGSAVDVELDYAQDALRLRVRDNGPGPTGAGAGHGLVGMRERAAMVGGALSAGPGPVSGFVVEATLPTTRRDAE